MNDNSLVKTCYMCDREATSREHVPPTCFFPENKESISGKDLRKNLITVPSCDIHNSEKSRDDLYLLHVISFYFRNNPEGLNIFKKRFKKTAQNKPHLLNTFFSQHEETTLNGAYTWTINLDMNRFDSALTCMVRAIYFDHFKTKWKEELEIKSPSLRYSSDILNYKEKNYVLNIQVESFDAGAQKLGENQDIFYYQFIDGVLPEHKLLRMVFYQGFVVLAIPTKRIKYIQENAEM